MSKPLVIVESPTKVRTIKKYIGNQFNVASTVGHIKDLPSKELGIDIEDDFKPKYVNIPGKNKVIGELKKAAGNASEIYLAPDPDREGEAIAFHTAEILKKKGRTFHRVLFHELTKNAIKQALDSPQDLNHHKYEAQQARRILDRLVGYQISPLLWRKVKRGLSAGRVQSVAVRIICEREKEIQAFVAEEYWSITAHLKEDTDQPFEAKLVKKSDQKIQIPDEDTAKTILSELNQNNYLVDKVNKRTTKRNPQPPFTTSKLQQDAINKLRFSAKKTMIIAQQLYEGIDLGPGEPVGLITYMRTDSIRISQEAVEEAAVLINEQFGKEYALDQPRFFKNKNKVQDAHEAIRPTSVYNTPEKVAPFLAEEQLKLYTLIWKRFVASQMQQALINQMTISIKNGPYQFTASGSSIKFPGFMVLYTSSDLDPSVSGQKTMLPDLKPETLLQLIKLDPKQHFTQPPPRFSEASLVKELEENGIGRPSTYATILSTIRDKGYVELLKGYFKPTELGFIVNELLVKSFHVLNVDFTANMETKLDRIEANESKLIEVLHQFYNSFRKELDSAADGMLSLKGVGFSTDLICPQCNKSLNLKVGKNGPFLACSGYPECTFSSNYVRDDTGKIQIIQPASTNVSDKTCDKCGSPMVIRQGKFGEFLACSQYPECKNTMSLNAVNGPEDKTGINCPLEECQGEIVAKKSKRGKLFYGCSKYPDCKFASWDKPVNQECPVCGNNYLVEKTTKKEGTFLSCPNKECGYKEILNETIEK